MRFRVSKAAAMEGWSALADRPGRALLTSLGTVLGVGLLVVTVGLLTTTQAQISARFLALQSSEIAVVPEGPQAGSSLAELPLDAEIRVRTIKGVKGVGRLWSVSTGRGMESSASPPWIDASGSQTRVEPVFAASAELFRESHARLLVGRTLDPSDEASLRRVAVVGRTVARDLGIGSPLRSPAIYVQGRSFTVVGILDDMGRHPELLTAIVIPASTARRDFGPPGIESGLALYVEVDPGATEVVKAQLAVAVRPDGPSQVGVHAPPDPRTLREQVSSDLGVLLSVVGAVALLVGAVGIGNATLVSVLERVHEIGLRRALGARSRHIALQFVSESLVVGTLGGSLGGVIGLAVVMLVAIINQWTAVLPTWAILVGPLLGGLTGLAAGVYPAIRAARLQPIEALRRS